MLDTDTASYIIKGRSPEIEAKLATIEPSMICISVITHAELMYGLKRLPLGHRLHIGVRQFLKILAILPWDVDAADYYAEIRHQLVTPTHWRNGHDDRRPFAVRRRRFGDQQHPPLRAGRSPSDLGQLELTEQGTMRIRRPAFQGGRFAVCGGKAGACIVSLCGYTIHRLHWFDR